MLYTAIAPSLKDLTIEQIINDKQMYEINISNGGMTLERLK